MLNVTYCIHGHDENPSGADDRKIVNNSSYIKNATKFETMKQMKNKTSLLQFRMIEMIKIGTFRILI